MLTEPSRPKLPGRPIACGYLYLSLLPLSQDVLSDSNWIDRNRGPGLLRNELFALLSRLLTCMFLTATFAFTRTSPGLVATILLFPAAKPMEQGRLALIVRGVSHIDYTLLGKRSLQSLLRLCLIHISEPTRLR